ncbi:AAA family ATPase [Pontibacter locisalis]|uniref:AAA family ATPase n=1 Tax=Pontibacter locisalis TaxID=1719035 RepID=A0ABW5IMG0_9BACT
MKNSEALTLIREGLQQKMNEHGWSFKLRPEISGTECTTWVQAKDVTDKPIIPASCQLITGGRDYPPEGYGKLDNVQDRLKHALSVLADYASKCGLNGNGTPVDLVQAIIKKYKAHLEENQLAAEGYKWELLEQFKGRPDLSAPDFYEEIKGIDYANLIYPVGIGVIQQLAKEKPEQYRDCFKILFDETEPVGDRIKLFTSEVNALFRSVENDPKRHHHHDERTIGTMLAYYDPDKYALYKDSFYRKYCKLIGVPSEKPGDKYPHYLGLLESFIDSHIKPNTELVSRVNQLLPEGSFKDQNHKVLGQDILYVMLDGETSPSQKEEKAFRDILKKSSPEDLNAYFQILDRLIEELNIADETLLAFSTSDQLSFQIGIRYCLNLKGDKFYFIAPEEYIIEGVEKGQFDGQAHPSFFHKASVSVVMQHYLAIKQAVQFELENNKYSNKKKYDNLAFRKAAFDKDYRATFFDFQEIDIMPTTTVTLTNGKPYLPLNQILFGPPGTGKTYHTVNRALEILGEQVEGVDRATLKQVFEDKVATGQIMFTTFHQSMSYEDFIEGIKPQEAYDKEGNTILTYKVEPGIFKKICDAANTEEDSDNFDEVYEQFAEDVQAEGSLLLHTPRHNKPFRVSMNSNKNCVARPETDTATPMVVTKDMVRDYLFYGKIRDWKPYILGISDYIKVKYKVSVLPQTKQKKDCVLIIDEINRGNVSQIFGELITLIEEDKRLGKNEQLEITLPYSKEKFGVPANLYIIGTMNTADRSVEALDTALRRRFNFVEMPPKYDLEELQKEVEGFKLADILRKVNRRIEKLLGKDNLIGHSYFLCVKDAGDLRAAFQNKIIPLLQEYFYGDYGKIGLVLGEGFFEAKEDEDDDIFASFGDYDSSGLAEKEVYHLADLIGANRMTDTDFKEALEKLMQ